MKQKFLLLLCLSALTVAPGCRNKRNENNGKREERANKAANKDGMKHEKKMKKEEEKMPRKKY